MMLQCAVGSLIASCLSQTNNINAAYVNLVPSVLPPDMKHEYRRDEQKRHDEHWHGSHFDAGGIVGVEPPHATGARAGVPVPGGGGHGGFPLPDCAATTCSRRYGFAGRPSNGAYGGSARCGGHCATVLLSTIQEDAEGGLATQLYSLSKYVRYPNGACVLEILP